jgi:hypothetical protein
LVSGRLLTSGSLWFGRDRGIVQLRKVALLQSKRLYPQEQGLEEDTPLDYMIGFARLMQGDEALPAQEDRDFWFSDKSRYRMISKGNGQHEAITQFEAKLAIPVHYLLYQPLANPWRQVIPTPWLPNDRLPPNSVGTEVTRARDRHTSLRWKRNGYSPTRSDIISLRRWRLEAFVTDELLRCREGYRARGPNDEGLFSVFNRRTGPIATAIAITIDRSEAQPIS